MAIAVRIVRDAGVGDVQPALVGGETDAVRAHEVIGHHLQRAILRIESIDVARTDLALAFVPFIVVEQAVGRIGEPDRAIGLHHGIVGRVEPLALVAIGQHRDRTVEFGTRYAPPAVLAADQPPFAIAGVAVGEVRRSAKLAAAQAVDPLHLPIVGQVAEHQRLRVGEPGWPFGPAAAGPQPLDPGVGLRSDAKARIEYFKIAAEFGRIVGGHGRWCERRFRSTTRPATAAPARAAHMLPPARPR